MKLTSKINSFWDRHKWIMPLCFVFSLVYTITSIAILRVRTFSGMPPTSVFNLGADIVSMAVCTVLLYSIAQDKEGYSEYTRTFALLISSTAFVLFTDAMCWIVQGLEQLAVWNLIVNVLNFTGSTMLIFFLWRYVFTALELHGKFGDVTSIIMNVLLVSTLICDLINLFYPLYFRIESDGTYYRQPLFMWSQTYLAVGLIILCIGFIISKKSTKEKLITASFVLIPVANQFITGYSFGLTTEFPAMLISIVLIFGVVVAKREQKLIATEKELYESKVRVMVSQIQPHFMYNALSSIAMLCKLDPDTASQATITFAQYLRGNMDSLKQTTPIPFEKELEHLKKYLYIEKLRFGKKLNIEYDIQATDFEIPQLTIQPLAENAVKHGLSKKKGGGTLTIATKETEKTFEIIVSDDGTGFDVNEKKNDDRSHIGMENIKRRLKEMCDADVVITSVIGEGTVAKIIIPKKNNDNSINE
ncbi:MAG: histidine kinase [Ruminococcus sp.]|nr:histidine kinase [Ruminococcus sp.]